MGTGIGGGGVAWGCGIGINGTCGFHLFLAWHNKAEASEECLTWRRCTLQQQHAPAGLAAIERVRVGSGMDEPTIRAALKPAVSQASAATRRPCASGPPFGNALAARLALDARGCITHAQTRLLTSAPAALALTTIALSPDHSRATHI